MILAFQSDLIARIRQTVSDAYGVTLAKWYNQGFAPAQVKHIAAASAIGLGTCDLAAMNILKAQV